MKIALLGYGRMGKSIEEIAITRGHEIVLKIDKSNKDELTAKNLSQADVAIDFSLPDIALEHITSALNAGIPIVSGTTGWLNEMPHVQDYCKKRNGAFLYASNFSIGVNIFFEINKKLAQLMQAQEQYNIDMEEIHHIHKLDSPSGTAITLANQIINNIERKDHWTEETEHQENDIFIQSKRIDLTPGTHSVRYFSEIDDIEIKHTAHSRKGFALGAVIAAEWIIGKNGIFTMQDVLNL